MLEGGPEVYKERMKVCFALCPQGIRWICLALPVWNQGLESYTSHKRAI